MNSDVWFFQAIIYLFTYEQYSLDISYYHRYLLTQKIPNEYKWSWVSLKYVCIKWWTPEI